MHMQCFARFPRLIVRPPKAFEASEQIGERDARFHPGQRRTDTEMQTVAEGYVRIGIARDIETIRITELFWIAIGGTHHRQQ